MEHIRKPEWLKVKIGGMRCGKVGQALQTYGLNTVCEQAGCPNQGECSQAGTATFMLLGNSCTRNCTFCKVTSSQPEPVDPEEPGNIARAAKDLGLRHVVVTSVTRDDLPDGGAAHFAQTIRALRESSPGVSIEVLVPDFQGDVDALQTVLDTGPDILNHNVETVPALYPAVRPQAVLERSLELLKNAKRWNGQVFTKSGFMVGLGETREQVLLLLQQLRDAGCDMVTIGQYLQPSAMHYLVAEYVHPEQFAAYKEQALQLGIPVVSSGPLVRSSYHAAVDFDALRAARMSSAPGQSPCNEGGHPADY